MLVWCDEQDASVWMLVPGTARSVASVTRTIADKLGLSDGEYGYELFMKNSQLLPFESAALIRDNDKLSIRRKRSANTHWNRTESRGAAHAEAALTAYDHANDQPNHVMDPMVVTAGNKRVLNEDRNSFAAKKRKLTVHKSNCISIVPEPRRVSSEKIASEKSGPQVETAVKTHPNTFHETVIPKAVVPVSHENNAPMSLSPSEIRIKSNRSSGELRDKASEAPAVNTNIPNLRQSKPSLPILAHLNPTPQNLPSQNSALSKKQPSKSTVSNPSITKQPLPNTPLSHHLQLNHVLSKSPGSSIPCDTITLPVSPIPKPPFSERPHEKLLSSKPSLSKPPLPKSTFTKHSPSKPPHPKHSMTKLPFSKLSPQTPPKSKLSSPLQAVKPLQSKAPIPELEPSISLLCKSSRSVPLKSKQTGAIKPTLAQKSHADCVPTSFPYPQGAFALGARRGAESQSLTKNIEVKEKAEQPKEPSLFRYEKITKPSKETSPRNAAVKDDASGLSCPKSSSPLSTFNESPSGRIPSASKRAVSQTLSFTTAAVTPSPSKPALSSVHLKSNKAPSGSKNSYPLTGGKNKSQASSEPLRSIIPSNKVSEKIRVPKPKGAVKNSRPSFMSYAPKSAEELDDVVIDVDSFDVANVKNKNGPSKPRSSNHIKQGKNGRDNKQKYLAEEQQNSSRPFGLLPSEPSVLKKPSFAENAISKGAPQSKSGHSMSGSNEPKQTLKKSSGSNKKAASKENESKSKIAYPGEGPTANKQIGRGWTILDALRKKGNLSGGLDQLCYVQVFLGSPGSGRLSSEWIQFMMKSSATVRSELQLTSVSTDGLKVLQKVGRNAKQRIPGTAAVRTGTELRSNMPILLHVSAVNMFTFSKKISDSDKMAMNAPVSSPKQGTVEKIPRKEPILGKLAALQKNSSPRRDSGSLKNKKRGTAMSGHHARSKAVSESLLKQISKNLHSPTPRYSAQSPVSKKMKPKDRNPVGSDHQKGRLNRDAILPPLASQKTRNYASADKIDQLLLGDLPDMDDLPIPSTDDLPMGGSDDLTSMAALDSILNSTVDVPIPEVKVTKIKNIQPSAIEHPSKSKQAMDRPSQESLSPDSVIDLVDSDSDDVGLEKVAIAQTVNPHSIGLGIHNDNFHQMVGILPDVAGTLVDLTSRDDLYIR